MNCYLHPETPATAFCRSCGRSLCALCQRPAEGTIFCQDHVPVAAYANAGPDPVSAGNPYLATGPEPDGRSVPYPGGHPIQTSPGLAFILGLIPGVGAIYNGQYLKGLMHALITGLLITAIDNTPGSAQPLVAMLLVAFWIYMPFEAFHTAKKRQAGIVPDEWSSIMPHGRYAGRAPVGPIVLIAIGVLYLLNSLNLVDFHQLGRFWPVILIIVGAYMLYSRVSAPASAPVPPQQFRPPNASQPFTGSSTPPAGTESMGSGHE